MFRTDSQNQHVNGQGKFGFCSSTCNDVGRGYEVDTRSKFVQESSTDNETFTLPGDSINLPNDGAIVFKSHENDKVQMPPS